MNDPKPDYSDPEVEMEWLDEQEENIARYLELESVSVKDEPAIMWCLAPYVSIWTLAPDADRDRIWIVSGDLPTDYIIDADISDARTAASAFAKRWVDVSECMIQGQSHPTIQIGHMNDPNKRRELGELLRRRASILSKWATDDSIWEEEP